ncbi:lysylphosphatidylglycerol synthase transmembrane domain-containing protein [Rhizobium sp. YTU87027]|uniref:lysylphosphatidylglycerol synthase transmembrane domain-containing protein n=1 Tax=Rhizobium sp. YTU87027 TaxID=3417741 RepID=UPI003D692F6F
MANAKGHSAGSDDLLLKSEQSSARAIVGWFAGALIFASVMGILLHFADIAELLAVLKAASPLWIAAAVSCQLGTYACAAAVWQMVTRRAGFQLRLADLLKLAVMELFANQAIPTGGLSGSLLVARGLVRRRIPSSIAITALLVAALSYYAAYFLMAALAFVLLWSTGDLSDTWEWLSIMFAAIVILITVCLVAVTVAKGRWIPRSLLRRPLMARLAKALAQVRTDIAGDPKVLGPTIFFQLAIFVLDATTLWFAVRALGTSVGPSPAFLAFVLASVIATVSPIPLGLGSFEGGCVAVLHLLGVSIEVALAATLIFRGMSFWMPMFPGMWLTHREAQADL